MSTMRFATAITAAALWLTGCSQDQPEAPAADVEEAVEAAAESPDGAIEAGVAALRDNDVKSFLAVVLPPEDFERIRAEYEEERQSAPVSEAERAQFAATMQRLTADGAEEQLMAELEPQLDQMAAQMPMMVGFGQMMAVQGIQQNEELTEEQKQTAQTTVNAIFTKLQATNLADKEKARQSIEVVTRTARDLDIETIDDARALDFDQAMGKAGLVMAGAKEVLAIYGFSLDQILDSVEAEVVSEGDDTATVSIGYDLFGTPQVAEAEMVQIDGRWYGAGVLEQLEEEQAEPDVNEMTDSAAEMDMEEELEPEVEEVPEG